MVTLTTEHGTFEAETEIEALKASRKAKRDADRQTKQNAADYQTAGERSAMKGCGVYRRKFDKRITRCDFCVPGSYGCSVRWEHGLIVKFETHDGIGELRYPEDVKILGTVIDNAGWALAVALEERGQYYLTSVGVCGECASALPLPGVHHSDVCGE